MSLLPQAELRQRAAAIRLAVFDVDGVMTDGRLYYSEDGRELKAFNAQDGLGIKHLQRNGVTVAVITGRESPIVAHRMGELGIDHVYQAREDKLDTYLHLVDALHLERSETLYIGDDLIDLPVLGLAGLAVSVPNGHPAVKERVHWITPRAGGFGAARDVCDLLLDARGVLAGLIDSYQSP
ncbi:MAG: HAD-IIIA family hydrolase [Pseudomonadota bacterium]